MQRFQFRLQKVLDVRELQEKQERQRFAKVYADFRRVESQVESATENMKVGLRSGFNANGGLDLSLRILADQSISANRFATLRLSADLKRESFRLEKAREDLVEAAKKRKALDILREKAFKAYRYEVERQENQELDEIGSQNYIRKLFGVHQ